MSTLLIFVFKTTICLTVLYLVFRIFIKVETKHTFNRITLLTIVIISFIIPNIYLTTNISSPLKIESLTQDHSLLTRVKIHSIPDINQSTSGTVLKRENHIPTYKSKHSINNILQFLYFFGMIISVVLLLRNIASILSILKKGKVKPMNGFSLFILDGNVPSFSFWKWIIISESDYDEHRNTILQHEYAHVKLHHFYDLLLLETTKILFWFNPVVYWLTLDMKEIHEYQADSFTLKGGIDSTVYQLLIIEKGVGQKKFALANCFNHCQIKKRIAMMNNSNSRKTNLWKVAIFLPVILLMLITNCKTKTNSSTKTTSKDSVSQIPNPDIEGAWRYVISQKIRKGKTYTLAKEGAEYKEMKIWSKDHFAFVGNQGIGEHSFGGNGRYKLNGNYYEEIVMVAPLKEGNEEEIVKMKLEIKNDTLYQIWPTDTLGNYDTKNFNLIKMVRME